MGFLDLFLSLQKLNEISYMKKLFCNACGLSQSVPHLIAGRLLGISRLPHIVARYRQMQEGYDCTYEEWQSLFTDDLRPFNGYHDTTAVTIPIAHKQFKQDFSEIGKGAIGLDLPTWFNIQSENKRIMLIFQDPLRSVKWYGECHDAVVSSPFGLQDKTHRENPRGGKMADELVKRLVTNGYGIYLTDARKFFVYDPRTSRAYSRNRMQVYADILRQELDLVQPSICILLGNEAEWAFVKTQLTVSYLKLPHLSGTARGAIVERYPHLREIGATAEHIAEAYAEEIIAYIK